MDHTIDESVLQYLNSLPAIPKDFEMENRSYQILSNIVGPESALDAIGQIQLCVRNALSYGNHEIIDICYFRAVGGCSNIRLRYDNGFRADPKWLQYEIARANLGKGCWLPVDISSRLVVETCLMGLVYAVLGINNPYKDIATNKKRFPSDNKGIEPIWFLKG